MLSEIYTREHTFLDFLAADLVENAVWFNNAEFARWHDLNGKKILSVFTGNVKNKAVEISTNDKSSECISKGSGVLFCRAKT